MTAPGEAAPRPEVVVVDASVVVAALIDPSPAGVWAERVLMSAPLAAPHLLTVEAANILRRLSRAGRIPADTAALAHADLVELRVALFPYEPVAERVWALRETVTAYDAWYVALAEELGAPLATLDAALATAPGPTCAFLQPPV